MVLDMQSIALRSELQGLKSSCEKTGEYSNEGCAVKLVEDGKAVAVRPEKLQSSSTALSGEFSAIPE